MTVQIELPQIITLLLAIFSLFVGFGKVLLMQIDKRVSNIENQNREEAEGWKKVERDVMALRAELPLQYVRREDYVRGQTVIEAKLDALYNKLEAVTLRSVMKEQL